MGRQFLLILSTLILFLGVYSWENGGYHISFMVAITSLLEQCHSIADPIYDITPSCHPIDATTPTMVTTPSCHPIIDITPTMVTTPSCHSVDHQLCYSDRKYKSENAIKTAHKLTKKAVHRLTNRQNYTTNLSSKTLAPAQSDVLALGPLYPALHSHKHN